MATMVGREGWHVVGAYTHGKIVEQSLKCPESCTILTEGGERKTVASSNVKLTLHEAIAEVEENIWYWERALKKLVALQQERLDGDRSRHETDR